MLKRLASLLCCVALLLPAVCLAEATGFSMAGFDGDDSNHDWNANGFFTRMEARTGVSFTFSQYTDYSKWTAAKDAMFASGELPDVLFKADLTTAEQLAYAQSGQLIDLAPLLAENAPNLWALLQAHPDWLKAITLPDGKIVALPELSETPVQNALWINQTWLDNLKLEAPTDAASLRAVLEKFLTGDPNQNGKADEVPLTFLGTWDLKFLSHTFGFVMNDYNLYVDEGGVVRFAADTDAYLELVRYLAGLYADGLMDKQGFFTTDSLRAVTDSDAAATFGVFFGPNPMSLLPYNTSEQYVLLEPLSCDGRQTYRDLGCSVTRGAFAITSACADPAKLLQWVDVLYSEEGAIEALAGTEGTDYTLDEDGRWSYAEGEGSVSSDVLYSLSIYDSGNMPWLFPSDFYNRYSADSIARINGQLAALTALSTEPFPSTFLLTAEQTATVTALQNKLGQYVDEALGRFVLGQWPLTDEQIALYRQTVVEYGRDELIAFWQQIYDALS